MLSHRNLVLNVVQVRHGMPDARRGREVLYEHPKVLEAVVISTPESHETNGASEENASPASPFIKAFVVLKRGEKATPDELLWLCRERLDVYKVPGQIEFRAELPKNFVGKVLRRLLVET